MSKCFPNCTPKADIARRSRHVRFVPILLKKSKNEWLQNSRECQFLVVSAPRNLCRTCTKVPGHFCANRCGPSRRRMSDAPAGLKNFAHELEGTFFNNICQTRTHAPQPTESYSITSSARASSVGGTVKPSALAVLRLIASSYLVGACTGRSAGFSPLRMRSTYPAARRN